VVRGIRRTIGCAPVRKAPATAELIAQMLTLCPNTLGGKRDRALGITEGRVFRAVAKGDRLQGPISGHSAAAIVKRYARKVGLDAATFAGHSLRSGFLTSSAEAGASVLKMIEVSRHKSVDMLTTYVRRSNLFREHAGSTFL
jgi:hypothetical protein